MNATNLIIGLLMIGIGFLVKLFPNLIAGYNTMSQYTKKNINSDGLSSYMRNGFYPEQEERQESSTNISCAPNCFSIYNWIDCLSIHAFKNQYFWEYHSIFRNVWFWPEYYEYREYHIKLSASSSRLIKIYVDFLFG